MRIADFLKIFLKLGLAIGLVVWLVNKGMLDIGELWHTARWYHFIIGVAICMGMMFVISLRWLSLVRAQGVEMSFVQSFKLTLMGQFFSYALPGGVSGDMVKGYYLIKASGGKKTNALVSILVDRFIGFWVMLFLASMGLFFKWEMVVANEKVAFMGILVALLFFFFAALIALTVFVSVEAIEQKLGWITRGKIGGIFLKVYSSIRVYSENPVVILKAFILSIFSQSFAILFMGLAGSYLAGTDGIDWAAFFFAVPLGFIAMAVPLAPAGIGVGQAVLFFLFNIVIGHESTLGPTVITAFQFALFCAATPGIYFYARSRTVLRPEAAGA